MKMVENSQNGKKTMSEKEKLLNFSFSTVFSKDLYCRHVKTRARLGNVYSVTGFVLRAYDLYGQSIFIKYYISPFPNWRILDSSTLKELANDNLKVDKMAEG